MDKLKLLFLSIDTYEEYAERKDEFKNLNFDKEAVRHLDRLIKKKFGKMYAPPEYHHDVF